MAEGDLEDVVWPLLMVNPIVRSEHAVSFSEIHVDHEASKTMS